MRRLTPPCRPPWFPWRGILALCFVKFYAGRTKMLTPNTSRVRVCYIFVVWFTFSPIFSFIGVPGSLRCQEKRTCRSQRLQPSRYFCLSIANMDSLVWGDPGPLISTAFPPHILTQILSYIPPEDRIRSLLNLIRLCGQTRRVNIRWVFNNFIYCT